MIRIEPFDRRAHDRSGFRCGEPALDRYLQQQAGQDTERMLAAVMVACPGEQNAVVGYYTLSSAYLDVTHLPESERRKLGYPLLPATLLGRLAVHQDWQGRRLGRQLLVHALKRAYLASAEVASAFVLVQAKGEAARAFYLKFGFAPFCDEPLHLNLPMKQIRALAED